MEERQDFKVGDRVFQKAPLGTYNTPMKIVSIISNLAKCEWTYEEEKKYKEIRFQDLIHDRNYVEREKAKRDDLLTNIVIDNPELFHDND